jgi:hypothetical protein
VAAFEAIPKSLQPHGDQHHLVHYMIIVGCQSDNVDQFTKFIDIVATMDCSATTPYHRGQFAT